MIFERYKKVFFVGIGGIGMSGVAEIMHNLNFDISGSDKNENSNTIRLKKIGVKINIGHGKKGIKGSDLVVFSSAIKKNNKDIIEARKNNIPTISRAKMLAEILRLKYSITISGSHGKTTTTSIISSIFEYANLDPTIINGGIINKYNTNAKLGKGKWIIAEADESDGSFTHLPSTIGVINNIDPEHLDFYKTFDNLKNAFLTYGQNIPFFGFLCICKDDKNIKSICKNLKNVRTISYGISKFSNISCSNIKIIFRKNTYYSCFDVKINWLKKYIIKRVYFPMIGLHNIKNALAAISVAVGVGIDTKIIKEGIQKFSGVKRRFNLIYKNKIKIFDDYAHHPVEISNVINSLKLISKERIIVVHEPHRYSRVSSLFEDFIKSLRIADHIILLPVFSAGEKKIKRFESQMLVSRIGVKKSDYVTNKLKLFKKLEDIIKVGDNIVFLGAGPITKLAYEFAKKIENNESNK